MQSVDTRALDASYAAFSKGRPRTQKAASFEAEFAKSVETTRGLSAENAAAARQEFGSPIPGMFVMFAIRKSQYEIQLFPVPRSDDRNEHVRFEDWHGDLMKAAEPVIRSLGHTIEYYPNVEHPITKGPCETFCIFRASALLALGDSVVREIVNQLVKQVRTCPLIPDSIRRAAGGQ